jgi:hypothetical protein
MRLNLGLVGWDLGVNPAGFVGNLCGWPFNFGLSTHPRNKPKKQKIVNHLVLSRGGIVFVI